MESVGTETEADCRGEWQVKGYERSLGFKYSLACNQLILDNKRPRIVSRPVLSESGRF
jgi:hypothetical protein